MLREPPRVATWVLARFVRADQGLIGDLIEEYQLGRWRLWYWKEVLIAALRSTTSEVRVHWLLSLRALIVFWAVESYFRLWIEPVLWTLYGKLPVARLGIPQWLYVWIIVDCLFFAAFGWIVTRLHRSLHATVAVLSLIAVLVADTPGLYRLAHDLMSDNRFRPYFCADLVYTVLLSFSAFLGGLWGASVEPHG